MCTSLVVLSVVALWENMAANTSDRAASTALWHANRRMLGFGGGGMAAAALATGGRSAEAARAAAAAAEVEGTATAGGEASGGTET